MVHVVYVLNVVAVHFAYEVRMWCMWWWYLWCMWYMRCIWYVYVVYVAVVVVHVVVSLCDVRSICGGGASGVCGV